MPTHVRRVRGKDAAGGKRTAIERTLVYFPSLRHVEDVAGMMAQLNKLQMGEWMLDYLEADEETSCCYLADGAESLQVEHSWASCSLDESTARSPSRLST